MKKEYDFSKGKVNKKPLADPKSSSRRLLGHEFSERSNAPGALARFYVLAVDNRNTRGIVAAIFEAT